MKYRSLIVLLAGILMCGSLTSCMPIDANNPDNFVDANLNEVDLGENKKFDSISFSHQFTDLAGYSIVNANYAQYGIIFVKNSADYIGIYSLIHNEFILKCSYYAPYFTYEVIINDVGAFIKYDYENMSYVIDNLGNQLISKDYFDNWDVTGCFRNGIPYISFYSQNAYSENYKYVNGNISSVSYIPNPEKPDVNIPADPEDDRPYVTGSFLKEGRIVDLAKFGRSGYYINSSARGITTTFDSNNKEVATYLLPINNELILTSDAIYYQKSKALVPEDKDFSYYLGGNKYDLTTYRVDVMSGKTTTVNFPYVIDRVSIYKDFIGNYTNIVVNAKAIDEHHLLSEDISLLLNKDLKVLSNYTEFQPDAFIKLDNGNYYNYKTQIIYDSKMKVVNYIGEMKPYFFPRRQLFFGRLNNKYGAVDTNGLVVIPFEYEDIKFDDQRNHALLIKDDKNSLFNLDTKKVEESYIGQVREIDRYNGFYAIENGSIVNFVCLDGKNKTINVDYGKFIGIAEYNELNDTKCYSLIYGNEKDGSDIQILYFKYGNDDIKFKTLGEHKTDVLTTGSSYNDAFSLDAGPHNLHANPYGDLTYIKLDHPKNGMYTLKSNLENLEIAQIISEDKNGDRRNVTSYSYGNEIFLSDEFAYYALVRFKGYQTINLTAVRTSTEFSGKEENLNDKKVLKEITPNENGYYKVDTNNAVYSIYTINENGYQRVDISKYRYDGVDVLHLFANVRYFFVFENGASSSYSAFKFNAYKTSNIDSLVNEESFMVHPNSKAIRSFKVAEKGEYIIKCNAASYMVATLDGEEFKPMNKHTYSEFQTMDLDAGTTYYLIVANTKYDSIYCQFSFEKINYDALPIFRINNPLNIDVTKKNAYRFTVANDGRYVINGYQEIQSKPKFYYVDTEGKLIKIESTMFNGSEVYNLSVEKRYVLFLDDNIPNASDYTLLCRLYNDSFLSTLTADGLRFSYDSYSKYVANSTGFYKLSNTDKSMSMTVYQKDKEANTYKAIKASVYGGENYYYLQQGEMYIIGASGKDANEAFYTLNISYYKRYLNIFGKSFEVNKKDWIQTSTDPDKYESNNHDYGSTSYMDIYIYEDGDLTINYDVSGVYGEDYIRVTRNEQEISLPSSTGQVSNVQRSFHVTQGDTVKVGFVKGSSSYNNEKATVYNITHSVSSISVNSETLRIRNVPANYYQTKDIYVIVKSGTGFYLWVKCQAVGNNVVTANIPMGATHAKLYVFNRNAEPYFGSEIDYTNEFTLFDIGSDYDVNGKWHYVTE